MTKGVIFIGFVSIFFQSVCAQEYPSACQLLERKIQEVESHSRGFSDRYLRAYWPIDVQNSDEAASFQLLLAQSYVSPGDTVLLLLKSWLKQNRCDIYQTLRENGLGVAVPFSYDQYVDWQKPFQIYSSFDSIEIPSTTPADRNSSVQFCELKRAEGVKNKKIELFMEKLSRVRGLQTTRADHERELSFIVKGFVCVPYTNVVFAVTPRT